MASTYGEYWTIPDKLAGANLASSQYKIVKAASTAGEVIVAAAGSDKILGVLMNDPADGEVAEVAVLGIVKCLAEASVAAGDHVAASTTARAKATTSANDHVLGIALDASGAAGDLIRVAVAISNY